MGTAVEALVLAAHFLGIAPGLGQGSRSVPAVPSALVTWRLPPRCPPPACRRTPFGRCGGCWSVGLWRWRRCGRHACAAGLHGGRAPGCRLQCSRPCAALAGPSCSTPQGILRNMLGVVEAFGHMPNGMRSYYLNRSQPPLLSQVRRGATRGGAGLAARAAGSHAMPSPALTPPAYPAVAHRWRWRCTPPRPTLRCCAARWARCGGSTRSGPPPPSRCKSGARTAACTAWHATALPGTSRGQSRTGEQQPRLGCPGCRGCALLRCWPAGGSRWG